MATTYTISDDLKVTLVGSVTINVPINPATGLAFKTYEEAEAWAIKAAATINLQAIGKTKIWSPYQFLKLLPTNTLAGCLTLQQQGDIQMSLFMTLLSVAKDIRSDDLNLSAFLDYCISKGILTTEQKNAVLEI